MPHPTSPKSYQGNTNLKGVGTKINWTPAMVQEYIKCRDDIVYFCEKYVKIIELDHGIQTIKLRDYQKDILHKIQDNRMIIMACSRQSGKTTSYVAFILHYILFNDAKTVAILANKEETAIEIMGRVRMGYELLPKWLQQGVIEFNKTSFLLENQSRVISSATSASSIRGFSINCAIIDEAAHVEANKWSEFFTSTYPVISSGQTTKIIMVSTPKGLNHFYGFWQKAEKGINGFIPIKVTWNQVPGRDAKWKKQEIEILTEVGFRQEHEIEFKGSTHTLIEGTKLDQMIFKDIKYMKGPVKVYEDPQKDHFYVGVVDVSRGKGLDFSAFSVIDVSVFPYQQVACYRKNDISPLEYAEHIHTTAKFYNNCELLIELNDLGKQVVDSLFHDHAYESILWTMHDGRNGKTVGTDGTQVEMGLSVTKSVKNLGCSMLKEIVENDKLIVNDLDTISEFMTYSKSPRKIGFTYEAESGCFDDMIAGLVIFGWLTDQEWFKSMTNSDIRSKLMEESKKRMEAMKPFGFFQNGMQTFWDNLEDDSDRDYDKHF